MAPPGVIEFSSGTGRSPFRLGIRLPALIHDLLHPFDRRPRPELELLHDLLSGKLRLPFPELADADSLGSSVIEMPTELPVYGAALCGIPTTFF